MKLVNSLLLLCVCLFKMTPAFSGNIMNSPKKQQSRELANYYCNSEGARYITGKIVLGALSAREQRKIELPDDLLNEAVTEIIDKKREALIDAIYQSNINADKLLTLMDSDFFRRYSLGFSKILGDFIYQSAYPASRDKNLKITPLALTRQERSFIEKLDFTALSRSDSDDLNNKIALLLRSFTEEEIAALTRIIHDRDYQKFIETANRVFA